MAEIEVSTVPKDEGAVDPCPECVQGKHTNCCTLTWDNVKDEAVECPCFARDRRKHLVLS